MATAYDLIRRTNFLVDDEMEVGIALEFMNEALEDLSGVAGIEKTTTLPMKMNEGKIVLPNDLLQLVSVYAVIDGTKRKLSSVSDKELNERRYQTPVYRLFGNELEIFPKPRADYAVIIESFNSFVKISMSDMETPLEVVTKLPEKYHRALSIYCAIQFAENDDNIYKIGNLKQAYQMLKEELKSEMDKKKTRVRSRSVIVNSGWY